MFKFFIYLTTSSLDSLNLLEFRWIPKEVARAVWLA